ncbi:hypothetical protein EDC01DRAFT_632545 [Geopyxis carbonaria]|nr:hypothetical protein EDC01DRAFT_632545 [Geopyxis carbonaria]
MPTEIPISVSLEVLTNHHNGADNENPTESQDLPTAPDVESSKETPISLDSCSSKKKLTIFADNTTCATIANMEGNPDTVVEVNDYTSYTANNAVAIDSNRAASYESAESPLRTVGYMFLMFVVLGAIAPAISMAVCSQGYPLWAPLVADASMILTCGVIIYWRREILEEWEGIKLEWRTPGFHYLEEMLVIDHAPHSQRIMARLALRRERRARVARMKASLARALGLIG